MDFIFAKPDEFDRATLRQGDLLIKNEALRSAIARAHSYYADASDYSHFVVLTQSCDLIRRGTKPPRSRYITIAAVRSLQIVIDRFLAKHRFPNFEFPFAVCQKERETYAEQLLERLLNNTQDGLFFIRKASVKSINDDLCVFLPLSIALRAEHYESCLGAKIAQLDHIFAAKIGWLTGNLYSRVGTPDIEDHHSNPDTYKQEFYEEVLHKKTIWLSSRQFKRLKKLTRQWSKDNPGAGLSEPQARELLTQIPDEAAFVAQRAVEVLVNNNFLERDADMIRRAQNILQNDLALQRLVRTAVQEN